LSKVLLTAPSRDPPRNSMLSLGQRGLPRRPHIRAKRSSLDSGVHDGWVNALQAYISYSQLSADA
jgi:hypothetical protein